MKTLHVDLAERSYPIYIGSDLFQKMDLRKYITGSQVMVVSNATVAPLYLEQVLAQLSGFNTESVILPDGEKYKTLEVLNQIFTALLQGRCDRKVTLIALGGGVIGDMAGFAAACYQRGVPFIQIPTTLLSQVDSSVGGKTGVNHALGKNMIGAFYQPQCVLINITTLNTLADRELSAGLAEVIKYGLIRDAEFFSWLEVNMADLLARDPHALSYVIERSCQCKAEIVACDETEQGIRAILNLGHTFGHAIETGMGYGTWLHGEAVGAGMVMAVELSYRMTWLTQQERDRSIALIAAAGLPVKGPVNMSPAQYMDLMAVDKKVEAGRIKLILLKGLGNAVISDAFDSELVKDVISTCQAL
ncbi:3-dehydroquinate synthase [hydrothermal vent metagenome]|uniref:3-dehydroquinate synthase n=1 Tax=hydrothermal vent metagenome TaxID=652676 RepID=A0A3B0ZMC3_9ZZZZ